MEGEVNYIIGCLLDFLKMCIDEFVYLFFGYVESFVLSLFCDVLFVVYV